MTHIILVLAMTKLYDPSEFWEYDYYLKFVPQFLSEYDFNENLLKKFASLTKNIENQCN